MQKSLPSEKEQLAAYKATAGVSDEDWKAYKDDLGSSDTLRSLRDCFGVVGLPTLPDLGDLAKDSANWSVEWRITEGGIYSGENNGGVIQGTRTYKESGYDITVKWKFTRKEK